MLPLTRIAPRPWLFTRHFCSTAATFKQPQRAKVDKGEPRRVYARQKPPNTPINSEDDIRGLDALLQQVAFENRPSSDESQQPQRRQRHRAFGHVERRHNNPDLPISPHVFPKPKSSDFAKEKKFRRAWKGYTRATRQINKYATRKENMKNAPFSFRFRQCVYANILARPVRMCQLTGARLPRSFLLDFHLLRDLKEDDKIDLTPASLETAFLSRLADPNSLKPKPRQAQEAIASDEGFAPTGSASYLTMQKVALESLQVGKGRWRRLLGPNMHRRLQEQVIPERNISWREDMPAYIQEKLQSIVSRKLGALLKLKGVPDNPGLISSIPRRGDESDSLQRLNTVDQLACVLRVKPRVSDEGEASALATDMPNEELTPLGAWAEEERKQAFSPLDLKPLAPATPDMERRFPTVPYRGRRIPIYDLTHLLGADGLAKAFDGTCFADSDFTFLVVQMHVGTVKFQTWLMALASYLPPLTIEHGDDEMST